MEYRFTTFDELLAWAEERWPGIVDIMTKAGDPKAEVSHLDFQRSTELDALMAADGEGMAIMLNALRGFLTMDPTSVARLVGDGPFEQITRNAPRSPSRSGSSCRERYNQSIRSMEIMTGEWDEDDNIPSA